MQTKAALRLRRVAVEVKMDGGYGMEGYARLIGLRLANTATYLVDLFQKHCTLHSTRAWPMKPFFLTHRCIYPMLLPVEEDVFALQLLGRQGRGVVRADL